MEQGKLKTFLVIILVLGIGFTVSSCNNDIPREDVNGEICGGPTGITCPEDHICDFEEGLCHAEDITGECVKIPEVCTQEFLPVCGCDGITYGNDCIRLMVGVQRAHEGECIEN
jgi:hypothetical protein